MCPPGKQCFSSDFNPSEDVLYPKGWKYYEACFERIVLDGIRRFVGHPDHPDYTPPEDAGWKPEYWFSHPDMCDKFRANVLSKMNIENVVLPESYGERSQFTEVVLVNRTKNGRNMVNVDEFRTALEDHGLTLRVTSPGKDYTSFEDHVADFSQVRCSCACHRS